MMLRIALLSVLIVGSTGAMASADRFNFKSAHDIPYGSHPKNRLDLRYPEGVKGFSTVINLHGGGLVGGNRHFAPWPEERKDKDPVAFVAVSYRLLTEATPAETIGDAATATAWVLKHIAEYGGDPKKVFVTGISGGGYLSAMLALDPKWMAAAGSTNTALAGAAPMTGQMTKHFNVRKVGFKDDDAQFLPKIDEWAPLNFARPGEIPPICLLTGSRTIEWKCRVEENELLFASLRNTGHQAVEFHETEGNHGGGVKPSARFLRDFVMKTVDADGVARFAPGERIAFFGDSITHGGSYWAFLQLFAALRHPGWNVLCLNVGISGDSAWGGLNRIDWDLMAVKPDRAFVMFGMNDVCRDLWKEMNPPEAQVKTRNNAIAGYLRNERAVAEKLGKLNVKCVLMTPSPYDQYGQDSRPNLPFCNDPGLAHCADGVRALANEKHLGVAELHRPMTEIFKSRTDLKLCGDRVHPNPLGHLVMASCILEAMGEGALVARSVIDAKSGKAASPDGKTATNAEISDIVVGKDGLRFTYAPKALPWPAIAQFAEADRLCNFTERFNREELVIAGLLPGKYAVSFDGAKVGEFAAESLAKGVNLALLDTPNRKIATETYQVAMKLRDAGNALRILAEKDRQLKSNNVDINDFAAADKWLDAYIEDLRRKKLPWLDYNIGANARYRELRDRRFELTAQRDDLYAQVNACRPRISRVTVLKVSE